MLNNVKSLCGATIFEEKCSTKAMYEKIKFKCISFDNPSRFFTFLQKTQKTGCIYIFFPISKNLLLRFKIQTVTPSDTFFVNRVTVYYEKFLNIPRYPFIV